MSRTPPSLVEAQGSSRPALVAVEPSPPEVVERPGMGVRLPLPERPGMGVRLPLPVLPTTPLEPGQARAALAVYQLQELTRAERTRVVRLL